MGNISNGNTSNMLILQVIDYDDKGKEQQSKHILDTHIVYIPDFQNLKTSHYIQCISGHGHCCGISGVTSHHLDLPFGKQ
jgi:hypothetical protein